MPTRIANLVGVWGCRCLVIAIELGIAFLCSCGLVRLGAAGGSWILGGILAGAIVAYLQRSHSQTSLQPNRTARKIGQMLVGLTVGFSLPQSHLPTLSAQLPVFVVLTLGLLGISGLIGYLYSRLEPTDLLTAVLATVPGNIGVMASIAADCGRDTALVSLVQLMRFTTVIFLVPIAAGVPSSHDLGATLTSLSPDFSIVNLPYLGLLVAILILTQFVVQVGSWFKVPMAAFLGAILVGLLVDMGLNAISIGLTTNLGQFNLPPSLNLMGQILLGITIGEYWGISPKVNKSTIVHATVPVTLTFMASLAAAGLAWMVTDWDWLTCLLVTAPGGSPEMILIALTLHQNVEVVTIGHLVRLLFINLFLPAIVSGVALLESRSARSIQPLLETQVNS